MKTFVLEFITIETIDYLPTDEANNYLHVEDISFLLILAQ